MEAHGRGTSVCPRCGSPPPEGVWMFDRTPGESVWGSIKLITLGLLLFGISARILMYLVGSRPFDGLAIFLVVVVLVLLLIGGLVLYRAGEIVFVQDGSFRSNDGMVEGQVHLVAGVVRSAFCTRYVIERFDVCAPPSDADARRLTSASARGCVGALRGALEACVGEWLTDEMIVGVAAVFGMAARGEIDLLVGRPSGWRVEKGVVLATYGGAMQLRLHASGGVVPSLPFERHLVEHVTTLLPNRRRAARVEAAPAGYRSAPARDAEEGASVELSAVLERYAMSSALRAKTILEDLRKPGFDGLVVADQIRYGFAKAVKVDQEVTRDLTMTLGEAITYTPKLQLPAGVALSFQARHDLLANTDLGELPKALQAPPPRPDVFSGKGYLRQAHYRTQYLPLLIHGQAARAVCTSYTASTDSDGRDVSFSYVWLDHTGKVRAASCKESYDPMHAAAGAGQGSIVVDSDANMERGRVVTVVYQGDQHVVYDALRLEKP